MVTSTRQKARQMESASTLKLFLRFAGYENAHEGNTDPKTLAIDRDVCKQMECGHCGKRGLVCCGFRRGRAYRVVAECESCGRGEEA